jgi:4-amino-4-deoxy-L-arabinose transferase-like glycosyltransferase
VLTKILAYAVSAGALSLALGLLFHNLGGGSLYDWDEAIYAQAAREMARSNAWGTITWNGDPFFHKPPLYFWLTALTYKIIGVSEFSARLWSALFGFGVVVLTFMVGMRLRSWAVGVGAVLLLLAVDHAYYSQWWSFLSLSRVGMLDTSLTFWITLGVLFSWEAARRPQFIVLIGLSVGLAILTKSWAGVLAAMIPLAYGIAIGTVSRRHASLWGLAALLAGLLILPWHLWQYALYGNAFVREYVGFNLLERAFQPLEEHHGEAWFYVDVVRHGFPIWGYIWPAASLWSLWQTLRQRDRAAALLLIWMALPLGLFSLAQTKIGWYVSMIYPAVALLLAKALVEWCTERLAVALIAAVMVICCIRLPQPADGSPEVKLLATVIQQALKADDTVYVIKPACRENEPSVTAGQLLVSDLHVRPALVFYLDRPLGCLEEQHILSRQTLYGSYVVVDPQAWAHFSHLGDIVAHAVQDGHGYILARGHRWEVRRDGNAPGRQRPAGLDTPE